MTTAYALTIGLNAVDPVYYQGWPGKLQGGENDATSMAGIAHRLGFKRIVTLLTAEARCSRVLDELGLAAKALSDGDFMLLCFSGHGRQFDNTEPNADPEDDKADETWCLYDGQLLDDEINHALSLFGPGVRVVVTSDSCHSGTVIFFDVVDDLKLKALSGLTTNAVAHDRKPSFRNEAPAIKRVPDDVVDLLDEAHAGAYAETRARLATQRRPVEASVVLLPACTDMQEAADGDPHGAFTQALLNVLATGDVVTYTGLCTRIAAVTPGQTPIPMSIGAGRSIVDDQAFVV